MWFCFRGEEGNLCSGSGSEEDEPKKALRNGMELATYISGTYGYLEGSLDNPLARNGFGLPPFRFPT